MTCHIMPGGCTEPQGHLPLPPEYDATAGAHQDLSGSEISVWRVLAGTVVALAAIGAGVYCLA